MAAREECFSKERASTALLLAHIAEVETRGLFLPAGYASMYAYCVEKFGLSEDSALKRIRAARVALRFPDLFAAIAEDRLNLNALVLLALRLTPENAQELISAASRKTRFQIETLIAERFPRSDAPQKVSSVGTRETDDAEVQSLELSTDPVDMAINARSWDPAGFGAPNDDSWSSITSWKSRVEGRATVDGIRLRCRAHNQYTAECTFGAVFMNDKRQMAQVAMKDVSPALRGHS